MVKRIISLLLAVVLVFSISACTAKKENNKANENSSSSVVSEKNLSTTESTTKKLIVQSQYLEDRAKLFCDKEKDKIIRKLDDVRKTCACDVVILTTNTFDGKIVDDYAVDYYHNQHYSADGCIMVLNMDSREWHIAPFGKVKDVIDSEAAIENLSDSFLPKLKENKYCDAMLIFIEQIEKLAKPVENTTSNNDNSETENIENFDTTSENHTPKISTLQPDTWYQYDSYPCLKYYNAEIDSIVPGNNNCAVLYFPVCANCHYVSEMCGWNAPEFGYPINKSYHCEKCGGYTLVSLRLEY